MYKMCHYEAAMDKIGEDIPWIEDEQNLPVRTYGGYSEVRHDIWGFLKVKPLFMRYLYLPAWTNAMCSGSYIRAWTKNTRTSYPPYRI